MCVSSLISRKVRFASILLSNAFAILLIATSSFVSALVAELRRGKTAPSHTNVMQKKVRKKKKRHNRKFSLPNETISTAADGSDRRRVYGGDFEEVAEDIVLNECSAMDWKTFHLDSWSIGCDFVFLFLFHFLLLWETGDFWRFANLRAQVKGGKKVRMWGKGFGDYRVRRDLLWTCVFRFRKFEMLCALSTLNTILLVIAYFKFLIFSDL